MEICAYDGCENDGSVDCFQDVIVEPRLNPVALGPVHLCDEHTRALEIWFAEMRYPDERIVKHEHNLVRWSHEAGDEPGR